MKKMVSPAPLSFSFMVPYPCLSFRFDTVSSDFTAFDDSVNPSGLTKFNSACACISTISANGLFSAGSSSFSLSSIWSSSLLVSIFSFPYSFAFSSCSFHSDTFPVRFSIAAAPVFIFSYSTACRRNSFPFWSVR